MDPSWANVIFAILCLSTIQVISMDFQKQKYSYF